MIIIFKALIRYLSSGTFSDFLRCLLICHTRINRIIHVFFRCHSRLCHISCHFHTSRHINCCFPLKYPGSAYKQKHYSCRSHCHKLRFSIKRTDCRFLIQLFFYPPRLQTIRYFHVSGRILYFLLPIFHIRTSYSCNNRSIFFRALLSFERMVFSFLCNILPISLLV